MHATAAAVETTTAAAEPAGAAGAVEPAGATVEAMISAPEAAVVKAPASTKAASVKAASTETASLEAASTETTSLEATSLEATSAETASVEVASEKAATEPRAGADKDATHKVVWTVVAVRRTRIWGIPVVTVGANRSGSYITGTNSYANGNLSGRVTCRKH
jgi:hypothetical protein